MNIDDIFAGCSPESILHSFAYTRAGFIPREQYERMQPENLRVFDGTRCKGLLVKYFPDTTNEEGKNYSRRALQKQTVYLADPESFNDPYDCSIPFDRDATKRHVLSRFADEFKLKLDPNDDIRRCEELIATHLNGLDGESLPRLKRFNGSQPIVWSHLNYYSMQLAALQRGLDAFDADCVDGVLEQRMSEIEGLTRNYGVACFAASYENQNMWAHYAHGYRGFAIEYDVNRFANASLGNLDAYTQILLQNIWDVSYVMDRPSCTSFAQEYLTSDLNDNSAIELYVRAFCTKQLFWGMEGESRLILPLNSPYVQANERNVPFLPIKAVYLGYKMPTSSKQEILELCTSGEVASKPEVYEMRIDRESFTPRFEKVLSRFGAGA